MGQSSRRHSTKSSASSHDSQRSSKSSKGRRRRGSDESYDSQNTTPTSVNSSRRPSVHQSPKAGRTASSEDDLSPSTSCHARSSTETFDSRLASDDEMDDDYMDSYSDNQEIPPLPDYRRPVADHSVRPSNPQDFAHLFPSMNRLSIRHDDFTSDGNMNLRVETLAPGRRPVTMQLFHLRMYDLAKREFSLRRYCRESGREVCNSKRKYLEQAAAGRPTLQRSVSTAFKNLTQRQQFRDSNSGNSLSGLKTSYCEKRPNSSGSSGFADDEFNDYFAHAASLERKPKTKPAATNTIKLEFSNYARVDVSRKGSKGSKHYDFEWWGHKYTWKREVDKNFGSVSFHLYRAGTSVPLAHIVPETRSPTQVQADEKANGWVPPCYMWISDKSIIDAMTDVADVVVATGLMSLVDDCIKSRWPLKKASRNHLPLAGTHSATPMAFVRNVLPRRQSSYSGRPIPAY